ncbi:AAA family ATPase [Herbiconiux sp. VKM Ac-1786]|uniref:AAA family ATPase n=1 Tax=Herbiconiux sp. VKM Ac-1786 TaxID=2783824 RepID=UPI00188BECDC|nr:AAA family ATPase [Herbiconiux sp. VKM Ac-1786]MBF4571496.1 AAA family ATPase [Herbiconiux sp. VKM Ac-1786]
MDRQTQDFAELFRRFLEEVVQAQPDAGGLSPIGLRLQEFLGTDVASLPVVTHAIAAHRLVDADVALADLAAESGSEPLGVSGGQMRDQAALGELIAPPHRFPYSPGPIDYVSVPSGPDSTRRVMSFGLHLLRFDGSPLVVLQRAARPERGRNTASLEVLTADPAAADAFLAEFGRRMLALSVLRGQVLSFTGNEYGQSAAGATFLPRPTVAADDVVLAPGVLDAVVRHVVGVGEQRERLRAQHQHLKRGVLLYGPPGTGKTLTVRHLLARTPGTTAVLLTGSGIRFVTEAAELARAMQPALVVLEDVDLVASDRMMHHGPQPLLFEVLDALDGLDGDADVAFVLTTNRVDVLERALADRPGRVDLAVEIALPDQESRRRLFARYADGLPFGAEAVEAAADRAEGTTGSFAKELVRRAVLAAAEAGREPTDDDLAAALDGLLDDRSRLTRSLLGTPSGSDSGEAEAEGMSGGGSVTGYTAGY